MKILEIGELNISFDEGKILNAVSSIGTLKNKPDNLDLEVTLFNNSKILNPISSIYSIGKNIMTFNNESIEDYSLGYINYQLIDINKPMNTKLIIYLKNKNSLISLLNLLRSKWKLIQREISSYSLFWYIVHLKLLQKRKSFLHASIFNLTTLNKTIAVIGSGGSGKTGLLFEFADKYKLNYLSEDFGIIDQNGIVYFNPKEVSLHKSDFKSGRIKRKYFKSTRTQKLKFIYFSKFFSRYQYLYVKPKYIFDTSLSHIDLNIAIYILRKNIDEIKNKNHNLSDFVNLCTAASYREMKKLNEVEAMFESTNGKNNYFFKEGHKSEMHNVFQNGLSKAQTYILEVPISASSEDITSWIEKNILN